MRWLVLAIVTAATANAAADPVALGGTANRRDGGAPRALRLRVSGDPALVSERVRRATFAAPHAASPVAAVPGARVAVAIADPIAERDHELRVCHLLALPVGALGLRAAATVQAYRLREAPDEPMGILGVLGITAEF